MKEIFITKNKIAIVDDDDYKYIYRWKWYYSNGYARRTFKRDGEKTSIYMHREIVKPPDGFEIDHINRNKLDNRRCNLRICTSSQNSMNTRLPKNNTSGYKGVSYHKRTKTWIAQIVFDGIGRRIGYFKAKEDAVSAYRTKAKELFGEFYNE